MSSPVQTEPAGLPIFRAIRGELAARDVQDLMAYPFFSLAKSKRVVPIDFRAGNVALRVEGTHEHGIATIWDADILIWCASQIIEARDHRLPTSRRITATPYEILRFARRGTSIRDYERLKAALDRLQSTTIATSIRQPTGRRLHRFSWINEWKECASAEGRPRGIELIIPDWLYSALTQDGLVLTLDRAYFDLTGGLERWLYRLARKHAGRQSAGWQFDLRYLHYKSGSLIRYSDFAIAIRRIVRRQPIPGYRLIVTTTTHRHEALRFVVVGRPTIGQLLQQAITSCVQPVDKL